MRFASGISNAVNARTAVDQACQQVNQQLAGGASDIAFVFASSIYRASWGQLLSRINQLLHPKVLIGCSGSGIIGGSQELEWAPAVSITAAKLPDVKIRPFVVTPEELDESTPGGFWIDKTGAPPDSQPAFILLADPLTCEPSKLINELDTTYRQRPIVGGLVSGGQEAGENFLFYNQSVIREGAIGVALTGNIVMDTIVSQGCRPIGRSFVITKAEDNVIWELGGRPAVGVLYEILSTLKPQDRKLAQQGSIFVGLVINEMRLQFGLGDFLIRNIVGVDPNDGSMAVSEKVKTGQSMQFQLRDAGTSRQELRRMLLSQTKSQSGALSSGALLFNCMGRGKSLYGSAHQDLKTIQTVKGKLPIGGFFCSGEIGPIGATNLLHGYTASLALFRPLKVPTRQRRRTSEKLTGRG